MNRTICHVANIALNEESGMGRVACFWKQAFERRGWTFVHLGRECLPSGLHQFFFSYFARHRLHRMRLQPDLLIVHEPDSGRFLGTGIPLVVESHGLERRSWHAAIRGRFGPDGRPSLKTRLLFPIWRLHGADQGLRRADRILIINHEDRRFLERVYRRKESEFFVFPNGCHDWGQVPKSPALNQTILFLGSWIARKGTAVLTRAMRRLWSEFPSTRLVIAGSGYDEAVVRSDFAAEHQKCIHIIPKFAASEERQIYSLARIFVMPSYFEGQPLSLLQAMSCGLGCIASNNSGQRDLIRHEENGLLFRTGDPEDLIRMLRRLLSNPTEIHHLGTAARASVRDRTWDRVGDAIVDTVCRWFSFS